MDDSLSIPVFGSRPLAAPLPPGARPWQARNFTQLAAAFGAVLPLVGSTVWFYLGRHDPPGLRELLAYPLLFGGGLILWLLTLNRFVSGDSLGNLGFGAPRLWLDAVYGVLLAFGFLLLAPLLQQLVNPLFPPRPLAKEVVGLINGLSRDPWLLALWLGPVVWIGVALFEELWRAFLLRRLWRVWGTGAGPWLAILFSAVVFAFAHVYQGPGPMIVIGVQALLCGFFYLATGRVRALILSHALFDSVQIVMAVIAIRRAVA